MQMGNLVAWGGLPEKEAQFFLVADMTSIETKVW